MSVTELIIPATIGAIAGFIIYEGGKYAILRLLGKI